MKKANAEERIKMVKAMEFIARQVNDEDVFQDWLEYGVADGDIEYGDMQVHEYDKEDLELYINDVEFADLMQTFVNTIACAKHSGGLYCDGVVSK